MSATLKRKITAKKARLAVIGLGYVGLPLAVTFAKKGFTVYGLDKDVDRVNQVNKKKSYISKWIRLCASDASLLSSSKNNYTNTVLS